MRRTWLVVSGCFLTIGLGVTGLGCGGDDAVPVDAESGASTPCEEDSSCDDGLYCNGEERCLPESSNAEENGCVLGRAPCAEDCDEDARGCVASCEDADNDGVGAASCGGTDCDDTDPRRYPGNAEVCDGAGVDEDCDERTFGVRDADGDSAPDALCCNGENCGTDCDDTRSAVNPRNVETCDGLDNDCDGSVDESVLQTFYVDADGDDFGSADEGAATMMGCSPPPGFATNNTDCADDDGGANPGVAEDCNGGDEDCDGRVDEDCDCVVPASRPCPGAMGVCAGGMQTCVDGSWSECSIMGTAETCDGLDNDCDGTPDDGVAETCYADPDQDGYAAIGAAMNQRCACLANETTRAPIDDDVDCRESPAAGAQDTYPGAPERCDGIDNDCSSGGGAELREDRDGDGYTASGYSGCSAGDFPKTDCHDGIAEVNPDATDYEPTGYCAPGQGTLCDCGGTPRCINSLMGCGLTICSPTSGTPPTFDWNCSGVTEVQPQRSGGCGPGGCTRACGNSGCGPSSSYAANSCGLDVNYLCCGGCPCGTSSRSLPLRCR